MLRLIQRIVFFCLALIVVLFAAKGLVPATGMSEAVEISAGTTVLRIGLLYLAFLCVLLTIDIAPQKPDAEGA